MKRSTAAEIICTSFILLFAYTASSKILDYQVFVLLASFQPGVNKIPGSLLWLFPAAEFTIILLLLFKKTKHYGFYAIAAISMFSVIYRTFILSSGRHLPCLCGPYIRSIGEVKHTFFELMVFMAAVMAIILTRQSQSKSVHDINVLNYTPK